MEYKDYYKILKVARNASEKEIRKAYRSLAREFHPDRNPGDLEAEERFKEINEAHDVLADKDKRRKYDVMGSQWQHWQQMGGNPGDFDFSQWFSPGSRRRSGAQYADLNDIFGESGGSGGFSDFFQAVFGGAQGQPRGRRGQAQPFGQRAQPFGQRGPGGARRGQDFEQPVEITLEEAYTGASRALETNDGRLEVKIPAGVHAGSRVRVSGKGGKGFGGAPDGHMFLRIQVQPHDTFERKGDDLSCEVPVDLYTAVLGGEVRVPTLGSTVKLRIPPETQPGRSFRLRGQGMPLLRDADRRGDLFARVNIVLPRRLSDEEKELFQVLAALRK